MQGNRLLTATDSNEAMLLGGMAAGTSKSVPAWACRAERIACSTRQGSGRRSGAEDRTLILTTWCMGQSHYPKCGPNPNPLLGT